MSTVNHTVRYNRQHFLNPFDGAYSTSNKINVSISQPILQMEVCSREVRAPLINWISAPETLHPAHWDSCAVLLHSDITQVVHFCPLVAPNCSTNPPKTVMYDYKSSNRMDISCHEQPKREFGFLKPSRLALAWIVQLQYRKAAFSSQTEK